VKLIEETIKLKAFYYQERKTKRAMIVVCIGMYKDQKLIHGKM
jgi:hypothetical protein